MDRVRPVYGLLLVLYLLPGAEGLFLAAQETPTNYVRTQMPQVKVKDAGLACKLPVGQVMVSESHVDALGRPVQEISLQSSPAMNDLVRFFAYDPNGRQNREYLPFPSAPAKGGFQSDPLTQQKEFYTSPPPGIMPNEQPYTENVFDRSPLDEITRQGSPGRTWDANGEHARHFYRGSNHNPVELWTVGHNGTAGISGHYPANSLFLTEIADENGHISREYRDKKERVIMKESVTGSVPARTFYIYDERDLLRAVIPPLASAKNTADPELVYYYRYDDRKRMVEKKIPGMEVVYLVYDDLDRLVLSQDGNLRDKDQWLFTKYDAYSRVVMTGFYTDSLRKSREAMQAYAGSPFLKMYEYYNEAEKCYSKQAFPPDDFIPLQVFYYDNYIFLDDENLRFLPSQDFPEPASGKVMQLQTGSRTRVLDEEQATWLTEVKYYDSRGRMIQSVSNNHTGGYDRLYNAWDFPGRMTSTLHIHSPDGKNSTTVSVRFIYDHAGRLLETWQQVNGQPGVLLTGNVYNELGELVEKGIHSADGKKFLQRVNYRYNERGWLTHINDPDEMEDDLFAMELFYDRALEELGGEPQFNGNISSTRWATSTGGQLSGYGYSYDAMDRLVSAGYGRHAGGWDRSGPDYSVPEISYDLNGNILGLTRKGYIGPESYGTMDDLKYHYLGNRLIALDDGGMETEDRYDFSDRGSKYTATDTLPEYEYDPNGNMVSDANKGILEITYNHLNLPEQVWFESGGAIFYVYDASGRKVRKEVYDEEMYCTGQTDYHGSFIYRNDSLDFILIAEGRLVREDGRFVAEYFLKDHLGNTRVCFRESEGGAVLTQENHYYPFGMEMYDPQKILSSSGGAVGGNLYLYNGKELQPDHGLGWYDYGARFYDPQVGRWWVVDALCEWHFNINPYHFNYNNPINFIDLFGLESDTAKSVSFSGNEPTYNFDMDEVVIKYKPKRSRNFFKRIFNWFTSGNDPTVGNFTYTKNGGAPLTSETLPGGNENSNAENPDAESIDIDLLLAVKPAAGPKPYGKNFLGPAKAIKAATNAIKESKNIITKDKEILQTSTGVGEKTNATGLPQGRYKDWINKEATVGSQLTDPSGDSVLIIRPSGDSVLYVPFTGRTRTRVSLNQKR